MANNIRNEYTVFKYVSEVNEIIYVAKRDIRIVQVMKTVADYFIEQIEFAKKCHIDYFIIDYDDNHMFDNLVKIVLDKSQKDYAFLFQYERNLPFAAAYMVKWLLPASITLTTDGFTRNGMTTSGVGITIN